MGLKAKARSAKILSAARDYPDPPQFPTDLSRSSIEAYNVEVTAYGNQMKTNLRGLEDAVAALQQKVNSS